MKAEDGYSPTHAHLIGIGGINMSGVAKILHYAGIPVSGSDASSSEITDELKRRGIKIFIGHAAEHIPDETDLVIYSSAVPESNPERAEARKRGLRQMTNFEFLGAWTEDKETILICGTHGKSTTTALAGLLLTQGGLDPMVIVGSRVPAFPEGSVRFGQGHQIVIEGDEYAKHFLEFHPSVVVLNNIELDHTDIFPDVEALLSTFHQLLTQVKDGGWIMANADDARIGTLLGEMRSELERRHIRIRTFGFGSHADLQVADVVPHPGEQAFALRDEQGLVTRYLLHIPGRMNVMNAIAAISLALSFQISTEAIRLALGSFTGIWRRFEKITERDGITVVSDYAHHPTAIAATIEAAKSWYPGRRIVVCFQPHHHRRTKDLFLDFIPSFDKADALLLIEIYGVVGRELAADQELSSQDLRQAIMHHDADRGVRRPLEFSATLEDALALLKRWKTKGDVLLIMGAGDIYTIAKEIL